MGKRFGRNKKRAMQERIDLAERQVATLRGNRGIRDAIVEKVRETMHPNTIHLPPENVGIGLGFSAWPDCDSELLVEPVHDIILDRVYVSMEMRKFDGAALCHVTVGRDKEMVYYVSREAMERYGLPIEYIARQMDAKFREAQI